MLYYHLTGYEWFIGSGYYNAATGEKDEYRNGIRLYAKIDDRFFGSTSVFGSANIISAYSLPALRIKIERLPFWAEELELAFIQITGDGKLIKMTEAKWRESNTKWREDISILTVYDL